MIQINLAPSAASKKRPSKGRGGPALQMPSLPSLGGDTRTLAVGAAAVLVLLLAGFGLWSQGARLSELQARVDQEVTDSTRFATTISLIQSLQARQDTIRQKIGVIQEVDQRRYVWPHLMDEISQAVPAFTWLTQVNSSQGASAEGAEGAAAGTASAGPSITLQGHAGSTQALTRLMKNLEGSPFIRDVTLVTSEQATLEGRAVHRFTLEARYESPDSTAVNLVPIIVLN